MKAAKMHALSRLPVAEMSSNGHTRFIQSMAAILHTTPTRMDFMYAAVDLGSNSFRLHIGEPIAGQMHIVRTARDPIRLAAGLGPDGALSFDAMETAVRSLRDFSAILREHRLDAVRVVATNTLRVATNAEALLPRLEGAIGYPVE